MELLAQKRILGPVSAFSQLPARIQLDSQTYYLVFSSGQYQLLSTVCPHQGGEVGFKESVFECQVHAWRFDANTGQCLNAPRARLAALPVTIENEQLVVSFVDQDVRLGQKKARAKIPSDLQIRLHAHACAEILHQKFSLLTDPWLVGTAFLGAWMSYPPPTQHPSDIQPDAIWISHEHSDHFHEQTLMHWSRQTPIYVPDFPNRRLVKRLKELGFSAIHPMAFGRTYEIASNFTISCYEPQSLWNDSVLLMEIEGFRILNLNDAGLNQRIAARVRPVDVIMSAFTFGASGYPLTWTHLSPEQKQVVMEKSCSGMLQMLRQAAPLYGASTVLPFAGHFTLWHPDHRAYVELMQKNTLEDVVNTFKGTSVRVVDLLPGEAWNLSTDQLARLTQRERYYDKNTQRRYLDDIYDAQVFKRARPPHTPTTSAEIESYFLRLNQSPDIAFSEDLSVRLKATQNNFKDVHCDVSFQIEQGVLKISAVPIATPHLLIEIPEEVLARVIQEDLSWDEALIGYWCRFSRNPDVYHAGFWRLLQAPYYQRPANLTPTLGKEIGRQSAIADVLEHQGEQADRLLRRYGLYCSGCLHSTSDTLEQGARQHGLGELQIERLVTELRKVTSVQASLPSATSEAPERVSDKPVQNLNCTESDA